MNKKKLLGLITSLSLFGGFTGAERPTFAMDIDKSDVDRKIKFERLKEEGIKLLEKICGESMAVPNIKIDKKGTITLVTGPLWDGKGNPEIGRNFELDKEQLREWLYINSAFKIIEYYRDYKPVWFKSEKLKEELALIEKLSMMESKKNKNIAFIHKIIWQYVNKNMENTLYALEDKIQEKKYEVEEKRDRESGKELEKNLEMKIIEKNEKK